MRWSSSSRAMARARISRSERLLKLRIVESDTLKRRRTRSSRDDYPSLNRHRTRAYLQDSTSWDKRTPNLFGLRGKTNCESLRETQPAVLQTGQSAYPGSSKPVPEPPEWL